MKTYYAHLVEKYSATEVLHFVHTDGHLLDIEINWKRASFIMESESEPVIPNKRFDVYSLCEEVYVDTMEDGEETFILYDETGVEITDKDLIEEIESGYINEGVNFLYDRGYDELDPEIFIENGLVLELADD